MDWGSHAVGNKLDDLTDELANLSESQLSHLWTGINKILSQCRLKHSLRYTAYKVPGSLWELTEY